MSGEREIVESKAEVYARQYRECTVMSLPDSGGCRSCAQLWAERTELLQRIADLERKVANAESGDASSSGTEPV